MTWLNSINLSYAEAKAQAAFPLHSQLDEVWDYLTRQPGYLTERGCLLAHIPFWTAVEVFPQDYAYAACLIQMQRMGLLEIEPTTGRNAVYWLYETPRFTKPRKPADPRKFYRFPISPAVRQTVLAVGRCAFCGSAKRLEVDHVVPHSKGGTDDIINLRALCETCNRSKGNR